MANQGEVAQALQSAGVSVSNLMVKDVGGTTAVYGSVGSDADKKKAESAIEERVGKIANHIEIGGGMGGARTYTVKAGDSLSKIAKEMYGDASQWKKIHQANGDRITDPDKIQPGWTLTIPA
jgi:nucleoid-associated protein YgaU